MTGHGGSEGPPGRRHGANPPGALAGLRVLDLTTERAWLSGRVLADLGALVTLVEPPGGHPARSGPAWLAFNRGKRSVTLDLRRGRDLVLRLVAAADVVVESYAPGTLQELGLGHDALAAVNPRVVLAGVTPFGQTGPYARHAAGDLVVAATGGAVWLSGDPDRPPVRISSDQYFLHAAAEAVVHTLVAVRHARLTGRGQHVDVSAQLATIRSLMNAVPGPYTDGSVVDRASFGEPVPGLPYRQLYACRDGHVLATVPLRPGPEGYLAWLRDEGHLTPGLEAPAEGPAFPELLAGALAAYFRTETKATLTRKALERRLMVAPVNTVADLMDDEQLAGRDYFRTVRAGGETLRVPGTWARLSATPLAGGGHVAEAGADNETVWRDEAGLSALELRRHRDEGVI
ncbi:CaiB/BaiF CoA transferase family protein [Nonomuraea harbinensis]|uniref:CaiB/BaiF CoA transferase family protein n=1 Tax=Nonomuraea harbinensis TaxID=1286938 RepID=A0ABW1C2F7_9ACTN|nr:CaiB/BaiF CoA-transferase family protein [Nonomuraea harbinensis]